MTIREVKPEIRILGWDDSSFGKDQSGDIPLVGSIVRGGKPYLDGVLIENIEIDGFDATDVIIEATNGSKHRDQLRVVMLDGITFAGFNTVDIQRINEDTGLPVIVVTRNRTDFDSFRSAMEKISEFRRRWACVEKAGKLKELTLEDDTIYFQHEGIEEEKAREILELSVSRSNIPEPVRISHLIASALGRGESVAGV